MKMLNWANRFNIFCFLDSQGYKDEMGNYDCLLAAGSVSAFSPPAAFSEVDAFLQQKEWVFGHFSYELKNLFYPVHDLQKSRINFPVFFLFQPRHTVTLRGNELIIYSAEAEKIFQSISEENTERKGSPDPFTLQQVLKKEDYLQTIRKLKQHIQAGDCYEINFCQEFFAENVEADPVAIYRSLSATSAAPFSSLYRVHDQYLISASPERFLKRKGKEIISQPMKGTLRRMQGVDEEAAKNSLRKDPKERSENVMIVDLMRNDLSRICKPGSVEVTELFGVYTFPHVYQMISTVRGELKDGTGFYRIMEACYPMGSMTGAPKYRVIELIDEYEKAERGIFSGSLGYFHNGDFDLNVVIRSLMYNSAEKYLSLKTGSGITIYSEPEKEWEECLLKAAGIKKVLEEPALLNQSSEKN